MKFGGCLIGDDKGRGKGERDLETDLGRVGISAKEEKEVELLLMLNSSLWSEVCKRLRGARLCSGCYTEFCEF